MEGQAHAAAVDPSRDISFETMIVGLLTKQILPDASVLGFSRSGSLFNREFLKGQSQVYDFKSLSWSDIETFIEKTTKNEELKKQILKQFEEIHEDLKHDILFLKQIVKIAHDGKTPLGEITTASDLFLTIIRSNLDYQNSEIDSGFTGLPDECRDNMRKTFQLCKENIQKSRDNLWKTLWTVDGQTEQAGVIEGTIQGKETWVSTSGLEIPVNFLKACGIFEVPPPSYDELTLTAQHLSFIEFFAAAGILLSSDIKSEIEKIENRDRFKAVTVYIRKDFVRISFFVY